MRAVSSRGRERFRQVVVGPALETGDLVGFLGTRRQENDRNVACLRISAQLAREFESAHVRQHPVEQDQLRTPVADADARRLGIFCERNLEAGAPQAECDQVADWLLVLDHQDAGFGHKLVAQPAGSSFQTL